MNLTREQLAQFLPDPRTIRQFEKMMSLVSELEPDTLSMLSLIAGGAESKANDALAQLTRIADSLDRQPPAQKDNSTDYIDFGLGPSVEQQRRVAWDSEDGTVKIGMGYDGVVQPVGLRTYYRIKASAAITKGQLVMFDGAVGSSGVLKGKPATGLTTGQLVIGVAAMDIANNGFGFVTEFGLVRGINTTGSSVGETWADGDILYYNPAYTGGLTKVQPLAPLPHVICASVIAASAGSGSLFVRVTFLPKVSQLSDVNVSSVGVGEVLMWDAVDQRWENQYPLPGYVQGRGLGGTATQLTSKSTAVSLDNYSGVITTNNAALAGGASVAFTLNSIYIGADDVVVVNTQNSNYLAAACGVVSGSVVIRLTNLTGGSLSDAVSINFAIIKGTST
jgi:hypothetical protein